MSHVFSDPITWNSLGPFMVWYTVGSAAIWSKLRCSAVGPRHAAEVPIVEDPDGRLVLGVVGRPGLLVP